jgi:tetratricopeptide (TPR) repeat protein
MESRESSADALFHRALEQFRRGSLDQAEHFGAEALKYDARHFDALHLSGLVAMRRQRPEAAFAHLRQAAQINPAHSGVWYLTGCLLASAGRSREALSDLDRALALGADGAQLHVIRASVLIDLKMPADAITSCRRALERQPGFAEAQLNLGAALYLNGSYAAAAGACREVLKALPGNATAHAYLGCSLLELQRPEEALTSLTRAVELDPQHSMAHNARALCLMDLDRRAEALASCQRAIDAQPQRHDAYNTRGMLQDDPALAMADFERAIALQPDADEPRYNKGTRLLRRGDFAEGWRLYESRPRLGYFNGLEPERLWNGSEDVAGKTFFTYAEQGIGDAIQFCRYVKLLSARGARVVLAVHEDLRALLHDLDRNVTVIGFGESVPQFDRHCALLSLPRAFGTIAGTIPADVPYLFPKSDYVARWRDRLGEPLGRRIGIRWQGSTGSIDRGRSFALREFAPVAAVDGLELLSLQKGPGSEQLDLPRDWPVTVLEAGLESLLDTAAVMQLVDLVITSDTSIAHLAGALGRPVWVVLKHVPDWRWMLGRDDSPWYPTMRLFRQPRPGDWHAVFADIAAALT